nr:hypothetical protein JVH1_8153 [Rhodococcus sp. JVH1]
MLNGFRSPNADSWHVSLLGCVPDGLVGRRCSGGAADCDVGLNGQLREPLLSAVCKKRGLN